MVDLNYLAKGLCAMSRSHHVNTMAGHLGAAVVAGYFIAEQHPDLDAKVYQGIEAELNRIIRRDWPRTVNTCCYGKHCRMSRTNSALKPQLNTILARPRSGSPVTSAAIAHGLTIASKHSMGLTR
jgi:hypothetical protein